MSSQNIFCSQSSKSEKYRWSGNNIMEHFEIGSCFKSYNELIDKLKEYCESTCTRFTTKDSRLITDEFASAKESFVYSELKLICVHGRTPKIKGGERKRKVRTLKIQKTECPAYFRIKLINSGVALQIVAMNDKHNHPLEKVETEEPPKTKKKKGNDDKHSKSFKLEIKSEDSVSSDEMQPAEFIEVFIDRDDERIEFSFTGLCAPVFNVFNEDGSLDLSAIPKYAKYLADEGIEGILVNDIVGECTSMSVSERKSVTDEWVKAVKSTKQHLMVQVGGCALPDVVDLAKHAEKVGVSSILCLPEACFKDSSPQDLVEYLKIVSRAAPNTPLLYYHIPKWTNVDINMAAFLRECQGKIPTFCGINYTSNDLEEGVAALEIDSKKNVIFFGVDKLLLGAYSMGFDSAIVPTLNIFPKNTKNILQAVWESKLNEARNAQKELTAKYDVISKFGALVPAMKAAMNVATSMNVGLVRPPLKSLSDEQIEDLKKQLKPK